MLKQKKATNEKLSAVPVKVEECPATVSHTIAHLYTSMGIAQRQDSHHAHPIHAEHDVNLTHRWESLPLVEDAPHAPKRELFNSFKGAVNQIL
ncbi:hypothetical protein JW721_01215 [Candidatus Micrarchaeota archaeon]|nr:hypothetical protein [Candidatus Micrarchaeota archaeon]